MGSRRWQKRDGLVAVHWCSESRSARGYFMLSRERCALHAGFVSPFAFLIPHRVDRTSSRHTNMEKKAPLDVGVSSNASPVVSINIESQTNGEGHLVPRLSKLTMVGFSFAILK